MLSLSSSSEVSYRVKDDNILQYLSLNILFCDNPIPEATPGGSLPGHEFHRVAHSLVVILSSGEEVRLFCPEIFTFSFSHAFHLYNLDNQMNNNLMVFTFQIQKSGIYSSLKTSLLKNPFVDLSK